MRVSIRFIDRLPIERVKIGRRTLFATSTLEEYARSNSIQVEYRESSSPRAKAIKAVVVRAGSGIRSKSDTPNDRYAKRLAMLEAA